MDGRADSLKRWRGLAALVVDAVDGGTRAVERVHMETAKVPFELLEHVPPIATPVKIVRFAHDAIAGFTYSAVRVVNRGVGAAVDLAFGAIESRPEGASGEPQREEKSQ